MYTADEIRKLQKQWTKKDERQLKKIHKKMKRGIGRGKEEFISTISLRPNVKAKLKEEGFEVIDGLIGCVIKW